MNINYLDGFSGYGGFHLALEKSGFKFSNTYFSEVNKYAIANYQYNFKNSIYAGTITDIIRTGTIKKLDLFTFGWPCQDNSIAGKRKGQTRGTRSGLLYYAAEIINEYKPRVFIAENVEGLRSVNKGIDIVESVRLLSFLSQDMPQYQIEMQLLNTRWFLPQNRPRLYFVGILRNRGDRPKILPLSSDDFESKEGRNKVFQQVASTIRAREYSNWKGNFIGTLTGGGNSGGLHSDMDAIEDYKGIRRFTPIECERLQGLPDNHTRFGIFNGKVKEISDTQRYKLIGNGVSIPVVKMLGKKILPLFN
jgi:DNA (cytosine-5)-methyltransferase 1